MTTTSSNFETPLPPGPSETDPGAEPIYRFPDAGIFDTDVNNCARCGSDHVCVEFKPLLPKGENPHYTHFAPCPSNGQPILMKVVDDTFITLLDQLKVCEDIIRENGHWTRYQEKLGLLRQLRPS